MNAAIATSKGVNLSVSSIIAADPAALYDLVADVTRMPEYSPETIKVTWTGKHTGPEVGATFKGVNKLGKLTWSTKPVITEADPGHRFSFKVPGAAGPTWTYAFEPVAGGTRVTESVEQAKQSPALIRFMQRRAGVTDRSANLRSAMTTTLDRLAAVATGGAQG
jgi:hypothetical protein